MSVMAIIEVNPTIDEQFRAGNGMSVMAIIELNVFWG